MRGLHIAVSGVVAGATLGLGAMTAEADGLARDRGTIKDASPAAVDWSGIYLGLHAGSAWGQSDWSYPVFGPTSPDFDGAVFGGHAGIQKQFGNWVLGGELSFTGNVGNVDGSTPCPVGPNTCFVGMDWLFLATGRLGYATDRWLTYVKGGYALASI